MQVSKTNMIDAENRIRNFIKIKQKLPAYCNMKGTDGKWYKLLPDQYCGMFYSNYMFWYKNGRLPNYVTLNFKKDEPTIINFQDNKYNCCPASLSMISTKLFKPKSETECAKILGTNKNGTNPDNLIANAPKLGFKVTRIARKTTEVVKALSNYKGIMIHYQTKSTSSCSGFENDYGHYAVIKAYKDGKYLIYDPTRGQFWCKASIMENATNGRSIYFYTVELI